MFHFILSLLFELENIFVLILISETRDQIIDKAFTINLQADYLSKK